MNTISKKSPLKGSVLNLSYAFVSNPNPIIASPAGSSSNQIDLTIIISNPHTYSIMVDKIEINIPVGEEVAHDLSTDPYLPSATYDSQKPWYISVDGSIITISTNTEDPLEITGQSINFKLNNISVNDIEGIVPITVTEYLTDQSKTTDANAYSLTKLESTYPVTNFYAQPEIFYRNGQATTLYWDCSQYGQDCSYRVHSDSWRPTTIYTADDGKIGVQTPALYQTTTFALDILHTDTIIGTLYTTVPVIMPAFYNTRCETNIGGIQRLVTLYWTAINASYCEIQVNGTTCIANAPTDTSLNGYPFFIGETDLNSEFVIANIAVIAYSQDTAATATYQVPSILIKSTVQHTLNYPVPIFHTVTSSKGDIYNIYGIGLTPDNSSALIVGARVDNGSSGLELCTPFLNKVSLSDFSCQSIQLHGSFFMRFSNAIATNEEVYTFLNVWQSDVTPSIAKNYIKKITLNNNNITTTESLLGQAGTALTKNGQLLLSARWQAAGLSNNIPDSPPGIVSINTSNLNIPVQLDLDTQGYCYITITPNETLALLANRNNNSVAIVDITQASTGSIKLVTNLTVGSTPTSIAITSDGKLALVTNAGTNDLSVINLDTLAVEPNTIKVGSEPYSVAITSDNQYAYIANHGSSDLSLVHIPTRTCMNGSVPIGGGPVAVVITNDRQVLVIQENSPILTNVLIG